MVKENTTNIHEILYISKKLGGLILTVYTYLVSSIESCYFLFMLVMQSSHFLAELLHLNHMLFLQLFALIPNTVYHMLKLIVTLL